MVGRGGIYGDMHGDGKSVGAPPSRALTFDEKVASSSQVKRVRYLPELRKLQVVFKSSPQWCYTYLDFRQAAWEAFQAAESLGSHLIKNVTRRPAPLAPLPYGFAKDAVDPNNDTAWAPETAGDGV